MKVVFPFKDENIKRSCAALAKYKGKFAELEGQCMASSWSPWEGHHSLWCLVAGSGRVGSIDTNKMEDTLPHSPIFFLSLSCSLSISLHLILFCLSLIWSFDPSILSGFPLLLACNLPQCTAAWTGDKSISLTLYLKIRPWFEELGWLLCVLLKSSWGGEQVGPKRMQCSKIEAVSLLELRHLTLNLFLSAAWDYFCC